ncbi:putative late blight resistance protein homolog R1B-14 [Andrographis paniculata]|uniref:putative late blight resistance protein homolog R1B-14 n=1 Tax=Andrographis paniculata TaxID=175694 RepID=UPI0021E6F078|nr:putative late blight resistance protein homolog R1B-14 [Andrographis paniculata]
MAYCAAIASLVELLEDILHLGRYPNILLGRDQIMTSLHQKFTLLRDCSQPKDEHIERRIRDAAYRAQDVIEFEISKQIESELGNSTHHGGIVKIFHKLISYCQNVEEEEFEEELLKVAQEVEAMVEELKKPHDEKSEDLQPSRYRSSSPAPKNTLVGFDEELMKIKDRIFGGLSQLQVIPIVGMGGIGKTALAKAVFDDPNIVEDFDIRVWVTISQGYDREQVLRGISQSMGLMNDVDIVGEHYLEERIYRHLVGRRYLVVLDDIWSIKVWEDLLRVVPNDLNGSRIVLTTRLSDIASTVGFPTLHMPFLNEEQSWDLLKLKVFGQELGPPELEDIGKFISSKCGGLPLAIVVIAGVLSTISEAPKAWEMVAADVDSILSNDECLPKVLSLSYNALPYYLKPCLLYMASLPENYEIKVSKLIRLWIDEGFVRRFSGRTLELTAKEYLEDLVRRNLVLVTKNRATREFKGCRLRNILRNFCQERAVFEGFFHVMPMRDYHLPRVVENARRISLYQIRPSESHLHDIGKLVRTVLWFDEISDFDTIKLDSLKLLRVMDVEGTTAWPIPDEIFHMFHLKYLELCLQGLRPQVNLPPAISVLQNLQTLIISSLSVGSIALPPQIWCMTQLRHLIVSRMTLPPAPATNGIPVRKLEHLQTLMTVENFICSDDTIEIIPNLRKLKISCTGNEDSLAEVMYWLDNLFQLRQLVELKLVLPCIVDSIFSGFALPLNLTKLSLGGCKLSWQEMTMVGCLPNLRVLRLREDSFVGEEWIPVEDEFLRLKFLSMERLDLMHWRAESFHFPMLENLEIIKCFNLDEIPSEIGDIPTLLSIDIYESSRGIEESAWRILEEQVSYGNDEVQVCVHS